MKKGEKTKLSRIDVNNKVPRLDHWVYAQIPNPYNVHNSTLIPTLRELLFSCIVPSVQYTFNA